MGSHPLWSRRMIIGYQLPSRSTRRTSSLLRSLMFLHTYPSNTQLRAYSLCLFRLIWLDRSRCFILPRHSSSLMFLVLALRRTNRRGPDTSCNSTDPAGVITPACLQDLYGIPATPATQTSNTLLVTGYVDEWAQISDFTVRDSSTRIEK
jgi:hypothetical protein